MTSLGPRGIRRGSGAGGSSWGRASRARLRDNPGQGNMIKAVWRGNLVKVLSPEQFNNCGGGSEKGSNPNQVMGLGGVFVALCFVHIEFAVIVFVLLSSGVIS